jgi:hypothetical protein
MVLRFGESDIAQRWARGPGRRLLTGIDLGRRRSREITRLDQVLVSAVVLARLATRLWSRTPVPWFQPHAPDLYQRVAARRDVAGLSGSLMVRRF